MWKGKTSSGPEIPNSSVADVQHELPPCLPANLRLRPSKACAPCNPGPKQLVVSLAELLKDSKCGPAPFSPKWPACICVRGEGRGRGALCRAGRLRRLRVSSDPDKETRLRGQRERWSAFWNRPGPCAMLSILTSKASRCEHRAAAEGRTLELAAAGAAGVLPAIHWPFKAPTSKLVCAVAYVVRSIRQESHKMALSDKQRPLCTKRPQTEVHKRAVGLLTGNFSSLSHRCDLKSAWHRWHHGASKHPDLFPLEFQILEEIFIRLEACERMKGAQMMPGQGQRQGLCLTLRFWRWHQHRLPWPRCCTHCLSFLFPSL